VLRSGVRGVLIVRRENPVHQDLRFIDLDSALIGGTAAKRATRCVRLLDTGLALAPEIAALRRLRFTPGTHLGEGTGSAAGECEESGN
jgi:hypothetical protein